MGYFRIVSIKEKESGSYFSKVPFIANVVDSLDSIIDRVNEKVFVSFLSSMLVRRTSENNIEKLA